MQQKIGRYQVKSRLGAGGMASIFLAEDPVFGREVAVKVLPREFLHDPSFRGRFEREARTIATLEHPNIVPVYDFGEEDGQPYLVMRYMRGGSLADRLSQGPLSLPEAARILDRIGSALDYAHSKGIVHRDLKPANILFDEFQQPFLADFGIAKLAQATVNLTSGGIIGTPAYMSPEQVHGNVELDGRSDVYTLGVILFEMLTGQAPYRADTPARLMMAHVLDPTPRPVELNPTLPPECNAVISRAMAKDRDERYTTAGEMAQAFGTTAERPRPEIHAEPTIHEPLPSKSERPSHPQVELPSRPQPARDPEATPPESKQRKRMLLPVIGGVVGLLLCCGLVSGFALLSGLPGSDETPQPTVAVIDESTPVVVVSEPNTPEASETDDQADLQTRTAAQAAQAVGATATAQALAAREATATAEAEQISSAATATAAVSATDAAYLATLDELVGTIANEPPVAGPIDGELPHLVDGFIETEYALITMTDFLVEATFITPYSPLEGGWDIGYLFRDAGGDDQYRLIVESNRAWTLANQDASGFTVVDEGLVDNLQLAAGSENVLTLLAVDDLGFFYLNGELIAELDLSDRLAAGDVAVATGLYDGHEIEGSATAYYGFTVWSVPE